jgi:hypothetical protein
LFVFAKRASLSWYLFRAVSTSFLLQGVPLVQTASLFLHCTSAGPSSVMLLEPLIACSTAAGSQYAVLRGVAIFVMTALLGGSAACAAIIALGDNHYHAKDLPAWEGVWVVRTRYRDQESGTHLYDMPKVGLYKWKALVPVLFVVQTQALGMFSKLWDTENSRVRPVRRLFEKLSQSWIAGTHLTLCLAAALMSVVTDVGKQIVVPLVAGLTLSVIVIIVQPYHNIVGNMMVVCVHVLPVFAYLAIVTSTLSFQAFEAAIALVLVLIFCELVPIVHLLDKLLTAVKIISGNEEHPASTQAQPITPNAAQDEETARLMSPIVAGSAGADV